MGGNIRSVEDQVPSPSSATFKLGNSGQIIAFFELVKKPRDNKMMWVNGLYSCLEVLFELCPHEVSQFDFIMGICFKDRGQTACCHVSVGQGATPRGVGVGAEACSQSQCHWECCESKTTSWESKFSSKEIKQKKM